MGNRKKQRWLEQGKQKESETAEAVEIERSRFAGKGETEKSRGGWKRGNRKNQRWLEKGKQKEAELAGKGET
jgi:hypothetical protein